METPVSSAKTFANLVKSCVGAGVLALPYAAAQGGTISSPIVMILMTFVVWFGMQLLVDAADLACCKADINLAELPVEDIPLSDLSTKDIESSTEGKEEEVPAEGLDVLSRKKEPDPYSAVARASFGEIGVLIYQVCTFLFQLGAMSAYISLMGVHAEETTGFLMRHWALGFGALLLILTLAIRRLGVLAHFSVVGCAIYVFAITVVIYDAFANHSRGSSPPVPMFTSFASVLPLCGTAVFALEGITQVLPFRLAHGKSRYRRYNRLLSAVMILVCIVYVAIVELCTRALGQGVRAPITSNLTPGLLADMVKWGIILTLIPTYLLQIIPVTSFMDDYCQSICDQCSQPGQTNGGNVNAVCVLKVILRIVLNGIAITAAIFMPNFHVIVGVSGAVSGSFVGFILPAFMYLKLKHSKGESLFAPKPVLAIVFPICIGVAAGAMSFYFTLW